MSLIQHLQSVLHFLTWHDYDEPSNDCDEETAADISPVVNSNIVYYIISSLLRKLAKKCRKCYDTIKEEGSTIPAAQLTLLRNEGRLKLCPDPFYEMLSKVEEIYHRYDKENILLKPDAFAQLLKEFVLCPCPLVGCDVHRKDFVANAVIDFADKLFSAKARKVKDDFVKKSDSRGKVD